EGADGIPRIVNGTLAQRALNGSLASTMADVARSTDTKVWAGYAIPSAMLKPGQFSYSDCCSDCSLDITGNRNSSSDKFPLVVPPLNLFVFVRFERSQVTRVRNLSSACTIDAAGTAVQWLTGVPHGESISYLLSLITANTARSLSSEVIATIAFHADPAAEVA